MPVPRPLAKTTPIREKMSGFLDFFGFSSVPSPILMESSVATSARGLRSGEGSGIGVGAGIAGAAFASFSLAEEMMPGSSTGSSGMVGAGSEVGMLLVLFSGCMFVFL